MVWKLGKKGAETVLYNFTGGSDGGVPTAGVVLGPKGNLYGDIAGGEVTISVWCMN